MCLTPPKPPRILNLDDLTQDFNPVHRKKLLDVRMLALFKLSYGAKVNPFTFVKKHDRVGNLPHEV